MEIAIGAVEFVIAEDINPAVGRPLVQAGLTLVVERALIVVLPQVENNKRLLVDLVEEPAVGLTMYVIVKVTTQAAQPEVRTQSILSLQPLLPLPV